MARSEGAEGPAQHLADAIAAAFARTEQPGEHLAVHAPKLAIEPRLQILRRHRRSLLLRLEHPYCSAVEDHVNRAPGVGLHRSFNLRIGITSQINTRRISHSKKLIGALCRSRHLMRRQDLERLRRLMIHGWGLPPRRFTCRGHSQSNKDRSLSTKRNCLFQWKS